jgi:uncharacterized protein YuzE
MKLEYDKDVDALYIRIQEIAVDRTLELEEGVNLDFDATGKLIGIEILDARVRYSSADLFNIATEHLVTTDDK